MICDWNDPELKTGSADSEGAATAPLREEYPAARETPLFYGKDLEADLSAAEGFPCFIDVLSGRVTPIKTRIFVAGFSRKCGLCITQDPGTHTVSRFHATVSSGPDGVYICDESLNGTYFGSDPADPKSFLRLPKGSEAQLKDGVFVRFATEVFQFRAGERAPL